MLNQYYQQQQHKNINDNQKEMKKQTTTQHANTRKELLSFLDWHYEDNVADKKTKETIIDTYLSKTTTDMTENQKEMHKQIKRLELCTIILSICYGVIILILAHYFTNE
jgi:hypothetical protein